DRPPATPPGRRRPAGPLDVRYFFRERRIAASPSATASTANTGASRLSIGTPATCSRFKASGSACDDSDCAGGAFSRSADDCACVSPPPLACACSLAGCSDDSCAEPLPASSTPRFFANSPSKRPPTSEISPRPNCAGRPVTFSSLTTSPRVPPSASVSVTVADPDAVPAPRTSLPAALITSFLACSSLSTYEPLPLYLRLTGPSLTCTVAEKSSPSTSSS